MQARRTRSDEDSADYIPQPFEIDASCSAIRGGWSESTRNRRLADDRQRADRSVECVTVSAVVTDGERCYSIEEDN